MIRHHPQLVNLLIYVSHVAVVIHLIRLIHYGATHLLIIQKLGA